MSEITTKRLIQEIDSLPADERALVADYVLKSLNPVDSGIEKKWIEVAERRLKELKTNKVKGISGDEVFDRIQKRFSE
jgi:putative addiction module component (TIGR02574 family)